MVLIASGLFFVWRRGRFSENSGGDSRKMFSKQEKKYCIYIYGIWYFKKTAHCSKRFVLSLRQEITRKSHLLRRQNLTQGAQKNKIISLTAFVMHGSILPVTMPPRAYPGDLQFCSHLAVYSPSPGTQK